MTDQELHRIVMTGIDEIVATAHEMSRGDGVIGSTQLMFSNVFLAHAIGMTREAFLAAAGDAWDGTLRVRSVQ